MRKITLIIFALLIIFPAFVFAGTDTERVAKLLISSPELNDEISYNQALYYADKIVISGNVSFSIGENRVTASGRGTTIFINNRDIIGNLGNKTTYGDNSPIIENNGTGDVEVKNIDGEPQEKNWLELAFLGFTALAAILSIPWRTWSKHFK